jgi:hypothetical protein
MVAAMKTHNYFKPRRRKIGVVTLVMACVFVTGWMRSAGHVELIFFNRVWPGHGVISGGGRFRLLKLGNHTLEFASANPGIKVVIRFQDWSPVFMAGPPVIERFDGDRVEAYDDTRGGAVPMLLIHYFTIVIPLTLLSAWLLLSRPRPEPGPSLSRTLPDA